MGTLGKYLIKKDTFSAYEIKLNCLFIITKLFFLCITIAFTFLIIGNILLTLLSSSSSSIAFAQQDISSYSGLKITHGIANGDVTDNSVVIWSRANQHAQMNIDYDTDANFTNPLNKAAQANETTDFTARAKLEGLKPDTLYYYRVWLTAQDIKNNNNSSLISNTEIGTFKTAPNSNVSSNPISFIWGGDLGGQKYCRNAHSGGYYIFKSMQSLNADFFIANGDMIYADDTCPKQGPILNNKINNQNITWQNIPGDFKSISDPAINWNNVTEIRSIYQDHWKYNRNDTYFKDFLKNTSMYSQWDDHEIINDFGSRWPYWNLFNTDREGYSNIIKEGTEAFFYYSPINNNNSSKSGENDLNRIYRSFNWGKDLDLFIIDARSYRSQNHIADTQYNNKTMLGDKQLEWLKQELSNSNATWKVISSDIPVSIPTANNASILGRDGWANGNETYNYSYYTGFERELRELLGFIDEQNIKNVVFITTDVHFSAFIKYDFDLNGDGNTNKIYELVSGPLNAVRGGDPFPFLDLTFNPSLIYGEGDIFNFGYVRIEKGVHEDDKVHFIAEIRDENGITRPGSMLDLTPE